MSVKCKALRSPWMSFPGGHRLSEAPPRAAGAAVCDPDSLCPQSCLPSGVTRSCGRPL